MSDPIEQIAASFEAFDRRLGAMEQRFVLVEGHVADGARATDEISKALQTLGESYRKLTELAIALDRKQDETLTMISNYVEATQKLRQTSSALHSEVREKLKAVP